MKGIAFKGDVKNVCKDLKELASKYKGMTVETLIRLKRLEEVEREQFGGVGYDN